MRTPAAPAFSAYKALSTNVQSPRSSKTMLSVTVATSSASYVAHPLELSSEGSTKLAVSDSPDRLPSHCAGTGFEKCSKELSLSTMAAPL